MEWARENSGQAAWRNIPWQKAGETINGRAYPSSEYGTSGVKLLRPGNLASDGSVKWTAAGTRRLPSEWVTKHPKHHIRGSEILINLTAQSLEDQFLGRACLSTPDDEFLLNQRIAVFRPNCMFKRYCLYVLKSPRFRAFVDDGLNSGSLIQHVHTKQLERFVFPVASEPEQREIVRRLDAAFARADRLEAEAARARAMLDRLEAAILAKALRGELVPQDPTDEPASVLLDRIRAERIAAPKPKRGSKSQSS